MTFLTKTEIGFIEPLTCGYRDIEDMTGTVYDNVDIPDLDIEAFERLGSGHRVMGTYTLR
jgi:hypothetical protein